MSRRSYLSDADRIERGFGGVDDFARLKSTRGGTLDENLSGGGEETSIGGGGPGADAPALRALAKSYSTARGTGQLSPDNPYMAMADAAGKGAGLAAIESKAQGGIGMTPGDLAYGRAANDAFAYEEAKRRADKMLGGFRGVRRQ